MQARTVLHEEAMRLDPTETYHLRPSPIMKVLRDALICVILCSDVFGILVQGFAHYSSLSSARLHSNRIVGVANNQKFIAATTRTKNLIKFSLSSSLGGEEDSVVEAIQSLVDYHQGSWEGQATSFCITHDVAAGIVSRKTSPKYTISVKVGLAQEQMQRSVNPPVYALTEIISWGDKISSRSLPLNDKCNFDVDSVDASYSLDCTLPDIPPPISGTEKLVQFGIEHCIAASDDRRVRCVVLYGADQTLLRIVVHEENRVKSKEMEDIIASEDTGNGKSLSAADLLEMQSDVDRLVDKITGNIDQPGNVIDESTSSGNSSSSASTSSYDMMDRLQKSLSSSSSVSSDSDAQQLVPHTMSLLELTSGVWLGDAVIRDMPMVQEFPTKLGARGFGSSSKSESSKTPATTTPYEFGSWSVGVQKVAWRWLWNYGEKIRQVIDVGKSMGAPMSSSLSRALAGSVCVDESLSRRVPSDQRMVYINWDAETVALAQGSVSMQIPRFLSFDLSASSNRPAKPFVTEFCLYQSSGKGDLTADTVDDTPLPEIVCSKIARVYNHQGTHLKQGVSSFYSLSRYGDDQ